MTTVVSHGWSLAARPNGEPQPTDFDLASTQLPDLPDGQVRVRNSYLSVDPYMRGRMNDVKSYAPPYALGEVMTGGAVGEVVESRSDSLTVGDLVQHDYGWRDIAQGPDKHFRTVSALPGIAPSVHLGVLGMTGLTAWAGLLKVAGMRSGETVFVSGAAGAVGSLVGQIARLKGASRVIGSAGSDQKVELLTSKYKFDAAFNYRAGSVRKQLQAAAPDGIDVYFDNVGGDHLAAAIDSFNLFGRAALCGAISVYNATEPPSAPRNLTAIIGKDVTLAGFLVPHYAQHAAQAATEIGGWLQAGEIVYEETVVRGLEQTPGAFVDLLRGSNIGKMVVALG